MEAVRAFETFPHTRQVTWRENPKYERRLGCACVCVYGGRGADVLAFLAACCRARIPAFLPLSSTVTKLSMSGGQDGQVRFLMS